MFRLRYTGSGFGHEYLPDLDVPGSESSGAGEQIILPHAFETCVIFFLQPGPGFAEVFIPGHQGFVIVESEIMPIFDYKKPLDGFVNLCGAGQHAVGEDVPVEPGVKIDL